MLKFLYKPTIYFPSKKLHCFSEKKTKEGTEGIESMNDHCTHIID